MLTRATARKRNQPPLIDDDSGADQKRRMRQHCDPIQILNDDIINTIFSHLSPEELVSLEQVSREWKAAFRSWTEIWGLHGCFPFTWTHAPPESIPRDSYSLFKRYARRQYLMQHGWPTKIF
ncbi:hypothetical protein BJX64DRAFT_295488 [Aspergillus heterothallicus]